MIGRFTASEASCGEGSARRKSRAILSKIASEGPRGIWLVMEVRDDGFLDSMSIIRRRVIGGSVKDNCF